MKLLPCCWSASLTSRWMVYQPADKRNRAALERVRRPMSDRFRNRGHTPPGVEVRPQELLPMASLSLAHPRRHRS